MKTIVIILSLLCGGCARSVVWFNDPAREQQAKDTAEWQRTGQNMLHSFTQPEFTASYPGHPAVEFGIRSDGVVVWRTNK